MTLGYVYMPEYSLIVSYRSFSDHYTTLANQNGHYLAISTEQFFVIICDPPSKNQSSLQGISRNAILKYSVTKT